MEPFRYRIQSVGRRARVSSLVAVGLILGATTAAAMASSAPASYVTGGVGLHESTAMLRDRDAYPLAVEIYARQGHHDVYTADSAVTVFDAHGHRLLHADADGPFLFADVPAGRYEVQVDRSGESKRKQVVVRSGQTSRAVFVFDDRG